MEEMWIGALSLLSEKCMVEYDNNQDKNVNCKTGGLLWHFVIVNRQTFYWNQYIGTGLKGDVGKRF